MSNGLDPAPLPEGLGIPVDDWPKTSVSVRLVVLSLLKRLETLEARLHQHSSNSSRPPSTDAPATKRQRRKTAAERRKPGGKQGHPGHPQVLLAPTATVALFPEGCACGQRALGELSPYHTHQVIELPVIRPDVTHWLLHQGQCLACGTLCKATVPADQVSGYGPRLTGFVGEMAGIVGASRSAGQDLCTSVFGIPLSKGAIQTMVDRVSEAIVPHYTAIGEVARASLVHYIDETSWLTGGDRRWLWVMANPLVAYCQIHPTRSKGAFVHLIADWAGVLGSDGYLVYHDWQGLRQRCLAHLIRTAQGLAERVEAGIARFGVRVHAELQRLCPMGTERPTVGPVAGLVCALPRAAQPPCDPGRQRRDVCPTLGAGRGGAVGVSGRPGRGSDEEYGGTRAPIRGLMAQTQPGDIQREGESGSVLDVEMAILGKQSKGVPIDEQPNDDVVHLDRLREADRLAD